MIVHSSCLPLCSIRFHSLFCAILVLYLCFPLFDDAKSEELLSSELEDEDRIDCKAIVSVILIVFGQAASVLLSLCLLLLLRVTFFVFIFVVLFENESFRYAASSVLRAFSLLSL